MQLTSWLYMNYFTYYVVAKLTWSYTVYPKNMHTVCALLCFVVVIHWLIFPYPSGLLHWHCGNLTIAPVPGKQPWWIWINTSCEFIMNDCVTTTKQSTTKPCAYFLGYTVWNTDSVIIRTRDAQKCLNNFIWSGDFNRKKLYSPARFYYYYCALKYIIIMRCITVLVYFTEMSFLFDSVH